jgi:hypothetical protein
MFLCCLLVRTLTLLSGTKPLRLLVFSDARGGRPCRNGAASYFQLSATLPDRVSSIAMRASTLKSTERLVAWWRDGETCHQVGR